MEASNITIDETVRALKGQDRPVNPLEHRMRMLAALECVDWVLPFEEETVKSCISSPYEVYMPHDVDVIRRAEASITAYLDDQYQSGKIDQGLFEKAKRNVIQNLTAWLNDDLLDTLSPNFKDGVRQAIQEERWATLTEVFVDEIAFGTAGIRGKAAMTDPELKRLKEEGIDASILKVSFLR